MRQWAISTFNTLASIYCLLLAEKIAGIEVDFLFPYGGKTLEWIYVERLNEHSLEDCPGR